MFLAFYKKFASRFRINEYFIVIFIICILSGHGMEVLLLFGFVVFHELCHVFCAYKYGLRIEEIELFPFGGVAKIDNLDMVDPYREIMISVAGPMFNVVAASLIFFLYKAGINIPYFSFLMNINISLGLFNLLPGLPLDGGRIIRAVLSYYFGYKKATKTAIFTGKAMSVMLLLLGIYLLIIQRPNFSLLLVPFFIFIYAGKEDENYIFSVMKDVVGKKQHMQKSGIMETFELCVYEDTYMKDVLRRFDLKKYHIIIVIDSSMKIRKVLTESQVLDGMARFGSGITFKELIEKLTR